MEQRFSSLVHGRAVASGNAAGIASRHARDRPGAVGVLPTRHFAMAGLENSHPADGRKAPDGGALLFCSATSMTVVTTRSGAIPAAFISKPCRSEI